MSGRLVVLLGLGVALSALWMMAFYNGPQETTALLPIRFAFGIGLATSITMGFLAIRRGGVRRHKAWMTRSYAIALGAGTQVFTLGLGKPVFGSGPRAIALLLIAAWCINLAFAEYVLRHSRRAKSRFFSPVGTTDMDGGLVKGQARSTPRPGRWWVC